MKYIKKYHTLIHILLVICALIIIGLKINDIRKPKSVVIERKSGIQEKVPTMSDNPTIDFDKLRRKYNNKDIKGAVRINNESFEEVVFQTNNNSYYLKHNYRGKKTNGEIFIDYRLDIDNGVIKVIYGEGTSTCDVFKKYYKKEYYDQHKYIELETDKSIYRYEVVSLIEKKITHIDFDINDILEKSLYVYDKDAKENDNYLVIVNKNNGKYYSIICKKVN